MELTPVLEPEVRHGRGQILAQHRFLTVGDLLLVSRSTDEGRKEETYFCGEDGTVRPAEEIPPHASIPIPPATVIGRIFNQASRNLEPGLENPAIVGAHPLGDQGILRVRQILYVADSDTYPGEDIHLSVQVGADTVATVRFPYYFELLDLVGNRALVTHTDFIPRVFLYELPFSPER